MRHDYTKTIEAIICYTDILLYFCDDLKKIMVKRSRVCVYGKQTLYKLLVFSFRLINGLVDNIDGVSGLFVLLLQV